MSLCLVSLDDALPALQAYLRERGDAPLDDAEAKVAAERLQRAIETGGVLVAFALYLGGKPSCN